MGHFDELDVDSGVRDVRGNARRVTVTGGATAIVRGIVSGPVTIGPESRLNVDGLFSGTVERNDGVLVIAGQANLDLTACVGRLGLAAGTTLVCTTTDQVWTVTDDGDLRRSAGLTTRTEVDATHVHWFDTPLTGGRAGNGGRACRDH